MIRGGGGGRREGGRMDEDERRRSDRRVAQAGVREGIYFVPVPAKGDVIKGGVGRT